MKTTREFRVEAHGDSVLASAGGRLASWGYHREPLLTREGAWAEAKLFMATGSYHTVKVFQSGRLVYRAFRLVDGTYCNAA